MLMKASTLPYEKIVEDEAMVYNSNNENYFSLLIISECLLRAKFLTLQRSTTIDLLNLEDLKKYNLKASDLCVVGIKRPILLREYKIQKCSCRFGRKFERKKRI